MIGQEMRKGLTRAETVIKQLEELGWAFEFRQDSDARVTKLICIPDISKKFLECFLEALIIDCTYQTNRYKLPLLDIVGQTSTNSTFNIGFGLLAVEDEIHYSWAIRSMRTLLGEKLAEKIKVVAAAKGVYVDESFYKQLGKRWLTSFCLLHHRVILPMPTEHCRRFSWH